MFFTTQKLHECSLRAVSVVMVSITGQWVLEDDPPGIQSPRAQSTIFSECVENIPIIVYVESSESVGIRIQR